ncbi:MAG: glycine cleavage system protein H [Deltaproteobacteria bacterium]|nr:glycine cleavage system protein H [Deltaproteobacteria bacterium]
MRANSPLLRAARITGLAVVSLLIVTLVVLPSILIGAFFLRPLGLLLAIVGIVAIAASPGFRRWLGLEKAEHPVPEGLNLPVDVAIHPHHAWAARVDRDRVHAGADHLLQRALGPHESIALPLPGTRVEQGQTLFTLARGDRRVDVQAPVSGKVLRTNPELQRSPDLLEADPYVDGWVVELEAPHFEEERVTLLRHPDAWSFLAREQERLIHLAHAFKGQPVLLADGGELVGGFHSRIDDRAWRKILVRLFGAEA